MGVWRKWIFPVIRILIFAAIAAALAKIAFFPDATQVPDPAVPGAEIIEPQVDVAVGSIHNDVALDATIAADAAFLAKAPAMGVVHKVFVSAGQAVAAGDSLMTIWTDVPREDGTSWIKETIVTAPATGVVSTLAVLVDQPTSVGDTVAQVAPASFHVTANLLPEQQYRLLNQPTEALVAITSGPAPFTCTGLVITSAPAGSSDGSGGSSSTTVTCAVPSTVRVFAGLTASMTIAGGVAENVLVVPITAVEGSAETGNVYLLLPDGSSETRAIVLGLSDGANVEVKEGLSEGDTILQFVPGAPSTIGDGDGDMPIDVMPPVGR